LLFAAANKIPPGGTSLFFDSAATLDKAGSVHAALFFLMRRESVAAHTAFFLFMYLLF
jgi:hypothetical protein